MTTIQKTYRLNGVNSESPPFAVPATVWTGCSHMHSRNGMMQQIPYALAINPTSAIRPTIAIEASVAAFVSATGTIFYGGGGTQSYAAKVHTTDGSTSTNRTPGGWSGAAREHIWSAGRLNQGCWFINTSAEPPVYWSGAACAVLPIWTAGYTVQCMRAYREFLIGIGVYTGAAFQFDSIIWSDAATDPGAPATWLAAPGNLAGSKSLQGGNGHLVDGCQLGDRFYLYKTGSVWAMDRINDNEIFGVRRVFDSFGAFGTNCVASDGIYHYVFTGTDVIRHDGRTIESIVNDTNRRYLQPRSGAYRRGSFVYYDRLRQDLWVCFPDLDQTAVYYANTALVINLMTGAQSLRRPPAGTAISMFEINDLSSESQTWTCDNANTRFIQMDYTSGDDAGVTIAPSITREALALDSEQTCIVDWVRPRIQAPDGSVTLSVQIAATMTPDRSPSLGSAQSFVSGTTDKCNFAGAVGRYHTFSFSASGQKLWRIEGFDVGYRVGGTF